MPTLQVTLGFVAACGGDREVWRRRWMQAADVGDSGTATRPRPKPTSSAPEMPAPAQLLLRPCGFIDRRAELDRLCREPAGTPVVITGSFGTCKSDFAMRYAHRIASEMVDGQLYADLGPLTGTAADVGDVLDGFLRALRVSCDLLPDNVDQRAGLYRSILAERRLLVVLDNVREEQQVRPLLAETRYSVTVLVSRTPLLCLGDVRRVRLKALSRADSLAAVRAAVPERAENEPREHARLAELCCDIPLALDITLRKLVSRPDLPLHRVNSWLLDPCRALDWLCVGDMSLRASLNTAYREVSEASATLLGRIARLRVHYAPGPSAHDEVELAEELVEAGLLHRGDQPFVYEVDRLVRAFAFEASARPRVPAALPL
ncbi:hypothetical protein [Nocardiopsis sp. MG754419]|uniref:hypothetical protein n=1 Tax=Nocardiopsis sp. MG754419 TaxID=2259865 RepID=UPI001BA5DA4B|nr:hypothetical protein [Nocardiopsis sp. MG754419]MBR8741639.1 XRE family transcriptional regulator [Nocardiopsis sp. MG754419]